MTRKDMTSKTWHDMIIQDRETIQDKPIGGQGRHEGLEVDMRIETFDLDCLNAPSQVGMEPVEHGGNKTEQRLWRLLLRVVENATANVTPNKGQQGTKRRNPHLGEMLYS